MLIWDNLQYGHFNYPIFYGLICIRIECINRLYYFINTYISLILIDSIGNVLNALKFR